jgi:hypothetical protein
VSRWGGRDCDYTGARDVETKEVNVAESAKPKVEVARDSGRWGGRASDRAGARDGMATDPPVSEPQRRAMFAAANGKSTLGIPKKVGKEFVGAK